MRTAKVIAVTGGVAAGKTAVTDAFARLGVVIVDADVVARELVALGSEALAAIVEHFGPSVLTEVGELDRASMRQQVFADPAQRKALESILHPRIRAALRAAAAQNQDPYLILAIPLLVESSHYHWVDRILVVDVPERLQIERVQKRDGISMEAARQMLSAQASRADRLAVAQDVLINDADLPTLERIVQRLHQRYHGIASAETATH